MNEENQEMILKDVVVKSHLVATVTKLMIYIRQQVAGLVQRITKLEGSTPGTGIEIADVDDDDAIYAALGVTPEQ